MFLRQTRRQKDGKTHSYWSVVENQRVQGGRVVQRHVLYLGEISPSQAAAWRKSIEVFDEEAGQPRTLALFPEDRCAAVTPDSSMVQLPLAARRDQPVRHQHLQDLIPPRALAINRQTLRPEAVQLQLFP